MDYDNHITRDEYERLIMKRKRGSKYRAIKTEVDGIVFDSRKEANRYIELKLLQTGGEISDLRRQVRYVLIPAQYRKEGQKTKLIERECEYIADFVYVDNKTGETIVEDTKGIRTPAYKIKRKLMLYNNGILIHEI